MDKIKFVEGKLENFDAVIATGSNNTARYFEYYFKDKPSIIRKAEISCGFKWSETKEQLQRFREDIFRYFGLGCEMFLNLYQKIIVPFEAIFEYQDVIHYEKNMQTITIITSRIFNEYEILDNDF
jgi:hypothetical protein